MIQTISLSACNLEQTECRLEGNGLRHVAVRSGHDDDAMKRTSHCDNEHQVAPSETPGEANGGLLPTLHQATVEVIDLSFATSLS